MRNLVGITLIAGALVLAPSVAYADTDPGPQPAPRVVVEDYGTTYDCGTLIATTYATTVTTPYVVTDGTWQLGVLSGAPGVTTAAMTAGEVSANCPAPIVRVTGLATHAPAAPDVTPPVPPVVVGYAPGPIFTGLGS